MAKVKVKLLTARVDGSESNVPGDIIEVEASEARALLETDQAEAVTTRKTDTAEKRVTKPKSTRSA